MRLSIVIITYQRAFQLQRCLDSIFPQLSPGLAEVLIYVNGEDCQSNGILAALQARFPMLIYYQGRRCARGAARNMLIKRAAGEIIYFLDDDVVVHNGTINNLLEAAGGHPEIAIFGGPNLCFPQRDDFQLVQSEVLAAFPGTAWMSQRYKQGHDSFAVDERSLSLCNLAIRREQLCQHKTVFNEKLVSCEENLLLRQLLSYGLRAAFLSNLIVFHERRHTYSALCYQMFQYGQGRMQAIRICPAPYDLIFIAPALFFLYVALVPLLIFWPYTLLPLLIYGVLIGQEAVRIVWRHRMMRLFGLLLFIFPIVHLCYGVGFLTKILLPRDTQGKYGE